jgi:putative glutamine amidotransferase
MTRKASPLIGITADTTATSAQFSAGTKDTFLFIAERYLAAIERAGAIPVILPANGRRSAIGHLLSVINGLVLSGGDFDIHPRYYGERPIAALGQIKAARTAFELEIAEAAMKRDLPVFGICGGAQAINVALGGSLYQDINAQLQEAGACEHSSKNPNGGHPVLVERGTRLFSIIKRSRLTVNTSHHQAVKRLGCGLIVNAVADDGVIEGIESTEHRFVLGVQWHPEVLAPRQLQQRRMFSAFVAVCSKRRLAR